MSFFGFDPALPRDRGHQPSAPGFGQHDAFAGFSGGAADDDVIDFEETYQGLGGRLDDADDAFNDDTFGGDGPATQQSIGKDFDFAGQTSKISNTMQEEQMLYQARQGFSRPAPQQQRPPVPQASKPTRTGYESYKDPEYIPQLEARADIWGLKPKQPAAQRQQQPEYQPSPVQYSSSPAQPAGGSRKMMSLDEVEAMMRGHGIGNEARGTPPVQPPPGMGFPQQYPQQHQQQFFQGQPPFPGMPGMPPGFPGQHAPQILQRPQQQQFQQPPPQQFQQRQGPPQQQQFHAELPGQSAQTPTPQQPTVLQRQKPEPAAQQQRGASPAAQPQGPPTQPRQILQNPSRLSGQGQPIAQPGQSAQRQMAGSAPGQHNRGASFPIITHPEQLLNLSEAERAAFLEEDAKRAKRNHKIAQLAKDNGLMTPQDKNFITRIQLQQLMTATGNLEERGPEAAIAEDFYYQVFSQIRGAPRQNPQQPASQFAQTYLFQTNNRFGNRRHGRGGDNHMQRMEQQIQRAVEAAKARPKAKQLVVEGSLGKIAFSNSKTPRPLLNIKRPETGDKPKPKTSIADRKDALRNIEAVYLTLMQMEDHERALPPPINESSDPEAIQAHMEWRSKIEMLHKKLWLATKIMEPINPHAQAAHPFIQILSHAKGKKVIPRLFRHIDEQERITVVTMIVVHLDGLAVVGHAIATPDEPLSAAIREEVELFSQTVMPPLFAHISESPLNIIIGLLGLILDRTNLHVVARTKIGLSLLTILISRAELLKQSAPEIDAGDWDQWTVLYNRLFDTIEPVLPYLFPGSINDTDDMYIWQFLAAMGVGASPEQQQRLVIGVKDRVMETVSVSKALPVEMAGARLANVNLFMRAIGLDVELLG
ncbi:DNA topoisomerase 2-associated protein pat1 [Ascochyta clinopodiicola]|nr:DNA topoisomerase 2-associated protein pat1 [Ascochyta clinopodiicola]